jgi:hypothetical protein
MKLRWRRLRKRTKVAHCLKIGEKDKFVTADESNQVQLNKFEIQFLPNISPSCHDRSMHHHCQCGSSPADEQGP